MHQAGFFLCAPEKNSREPKLKKMETQEKKLKLKTKYLFPGILGGKKKGNSQKFFIILPQMNWKLSGSGRKIANFLKKSTILS